MAAIHAGRYIVRPEFRGVRLQVRKSLPAIPDCLMASALGQE